MAGLELDDDVAKEAPDGLVYVMFCVRALYYAEKCGLVISSDTDEATKITQNEDLRKSVANAKWAQAAKKAV